MTQSVLITGASSGIGKAAALRFSEMGWQVTASMRHPEAAAEWARPAGIFTPRLDVTDEGSIDAAVRATIDWARRIDVLVNNAGYGLWGPLEGTTSDMLREQFDTNVLGLAAVTRAVLPHMRRAGGGVVINISSIGGRLTFPLGSAYHATKWAVEGLTESLQYELSPHNIRVKLVEPGGIRTDFVSRGMVRSQHPAYAEWVEGLDRYFERTNPGLPGPGKVAQTIYRAATDGSRRLRYPVHHQPLMLLHALLPDSGWRGLMGRMVRGLMRKPERVAGGVAVHH